MLVAVEQPLAVAGGDRERDDLARVGQPLSGGVRRVQRGLGGGQRGRDRDRVADPARHLDRLLHQLLAARAGRAVAQRRGQAREQPDAQRAVVRSDGDEPFLEQRDEAVVGEPVRPQEPSAVARGGAGEHQRQSGRPCHVRRPQARRLRARVVPAPALRVTERQQQLTALRGGRRAARVERRERQRVQPHRLLVGQLRDRAGARAPGVADRLGRGGLVEVMRELGEMRIELGRVDGLERLAHAAMQLDPPSPGQTVIGGVPDQGVREAHAADRAWDLGDHARFGRLVEQVQDGAALEPADARQGVEIELAPEDRGQREQLVAVVRQVAQPAADRLADAVRDGQRRLRELPLPAEQPHDLADEQRVALGLGEHRRTQLGGSDRGGRERDEAG